MYQEEDIPYYQIMGAFLEQYPKETQAMSLFLDILDETGRREATASSVTKAIVEANHILR